MTIESIQVPKKSQEVRGTSASVMYALPERDRNRLNELLVMGLTIQEALGVLADSIASRVGQVIRGGSKTIENPFRSP